MICLYCDKELKATQNKEYKTCDSCFILYVDECLEVRNCKKMYLFKDEKSFSCWHTHDTEYLVLSYYNNPFITYKYILSFCKNNTIKLIKSSNEEIKLTMEEAKTLIKHHSMTFIL